MLKIVLASQSPRRKKLLTQLGLIFEVIPSTLQEITTATDPSEIVCELSLQKAVDVSKGLKDSLIIGSDTIVVHKGKILGKPLTEIEASEMLGKLSNSSHSVFTGVSFVQTNAHNKVVRSLSFFEETKVWFSPLTKEEIANYISTGSPMDKAGSYGIQDDWGSVFVKKIEGDYYTVVGFPLNRFYRELKHFEPSLIKNLSIPVN